MSSTYLVLKRLVVRNVNAQPAWWFLGPPGPMTYAGFTHALARRCQTGEPAVTGFALVHHHFELLAEALAIGDSLVRPHLLRGASYIDMSDYPDSKRPMLSSQPTVRGNLTISLLVRFDSEAAVSLDAAREFLAVSRLAGGRIESFGAVYFEDSLERAQSRLGSGWGVHERTDLLTNTEGEPLDALLAATRPDNQSKEPWLLPANLGFGLLTEPRERRMSRDGYPHAFAEPLVGLVQYRPSRKEAPPFWRSTRPHTRAFVVTTEPATTITSKEFA